MNRREFLATSAAVTGATVLPQETRATALSRSDSAVADAKHGCVHLAVDKPCTPFGSPPRTTRRV